ncbi:TolC family protein [Marinoscillum pacificum]|uniref:TolC family protein n=1 Tax=Marinoscillum pacificum TaxID=392723 RepID=UPI002157409A|nr:TolC family protein [Marinoscillum pacificum]
MKRTLLSVTLLAYFLTAFGQDDQEITALTLDDCIETALERNIRLKQVRNNQIIAESNRFQSIMNFFPSVSAGINYDYFFGNFFDTNAARQVSETTNSSNPNLSARVVLFNGFSNQYLVKQRKNELYAAEQTSESTRREIESLILGSYLTVILDKENIKIAQERVDLLAAQLDREKKRESVGVGNLESVYNFQSQLASQKLSLNNLQNTLQRDLLALFQAMALDPGNKYEVLPYEVQEEDLLLEVASFDEVLEESLSSSPALMAARSSYSASRYILKSARAQRLPTITASGVIGSNYSSNGARNPSTGEVESNASFMDQMEYNAFEYLNFSMNIPIFTRFQTSNNIQTAKVNMINAELDVDQALVNVTNTVQSVYLDLVAAQNTYVSAKENLEATAQTFEFMKKRFDTGNTDFYTYLESLNNKNRAELELINAKYSIVFRQKILEIYKGSESSVN